MKKTLLFLCFVIFCVTTSFAVCDYTEQCPNNEFALSSKSWRKFSNKIGATMLSEKVAEARIKKELKKVTDQKLNVSVKSYSFQDTLQGRLHSIIISGKNLNLEGVYLSSLELKTLCDFNYVQIDKNPIQFKENMIIRFTTVISDQDLMKTMKSNGYLNKLNCVNVKGCGITFFKLSGAGVSIKNDKLNFKVKVTSELLLEKPLDIDISSDLTIKDGRIVFTKVDLGNISTNVDLSRVGSRLNAMNPLIFSLDVLENKNTKMCIKSVKIVEDKVIVVGNVFIPKTVL